MCPFSYDHILPLSGQQCLLTLLFVLPLAESSFSVPAFSNCKSRNLTNVKELEFSGSAGKHVTWYNDSPLWSSSAISPCSQDQSLQPAQ